MKVEFERLIRGRYVYEVCVLVIKKYRGICTASIYCILLSFCLFPVDIIYMSFLINLMEKSTFVGLNNYIQLAKDATFIKSLKNNILIVVVL